MGSLRSKYPGTTVAHFALTRLPTSTAVRQVARNLSRNSALPVVSEVFQLSPPSMTNTPMVMPRRASVAPIFSCTSTGRPMSPLSSSAVKPWRP